MREITFDIETIPNTSMIRRLPKLEIKAGNLKDPAKIAEKEAAARAEQIDKMALSPLYGRICAWVAVEDEKTSGATASMPKRTKRKPGSSRMLSRTLPGPA